MTDPTSSIPELECWLASTVADRCGLAIDEVDVDRPLVDYGLSSRDAVELAGRLEDLLDRTLPTTLVWDHPTIEQLAAALLHPESPQPSSSASRASPVSPASPASPAAAAVDGVAVIGLGCRLPGGIAGPEDFWRLLDRGGDAVGEVPRERWRRPETAADSAVLERTTRNGGFLADIAGFDAEFFAISPREARRIDPQQRLVLEVAWEALEHAGISPDSLRGTPTGVFVGISASEYGQQSLDVLSGIDAWSSTGGALSIAANRLSYALDLRGPSLAVDTACSSSLVAVQLGAQSLLVGESNLVIAAGANILLGPALTAAFHEMGLISPTGHCQPFSAVADGIVRGEGVGVVVLKRLADATRDGDRVLAVLRAGAVNQDGRSAGITAPNVDAQVEVLRRAYAIAGVDPGDVDYVEAHGTGTLLGDPIEARALGAVLGARRAPTNPLLIGSVKSNLGHLEAAAGIVGLIKTVLAIDHGRIPPSLHFTPGHAHVDLAGLGLAVVDRATDWPASSRPFRAGVSAFGFGGTNVHVVVEAPTPAGGPPRAGATRATRAAGATRATRAAGATGARSAQPGDVADRVRRFVLGGPNPARVRDRAGQLAAWLAGAGDAPALDDLEFTLARRLAGRARAGVIARDRDSLIAGLRACAAGDDAPNLVAVNGARATAAGAVWVFSGHGSQWTGMCLRLIREEPVFARALEEIDALISVAAGFSVRDELRREDELTAMERVQPVLFAIQVALSRLLRANGLNPAAVIGHSVGEVAAAVVSGALSLDDGVRVVTLRSRLLGTLNGRGSIALLEVSPAELAPLLGHYTAIELAAYNAPTQTAVAGASDEIARLVAEVDDRGLLAKLIKATAPSHSRLVDPIVGPLTAALRGLVPRELDAAFYTTVLDDPRTIPAFDAGYWAANIRRPVRFAQAIAAAIGDGHRSFIEVSPHPILTAAVLDNAVAAGVSRPLVLSTGRRSDDEVAHLHGQLTTLMLDSGHPAAFGRGPGRLIDIPTTPWRHEPHWLPSSTRRTAFAALALLGERIELPGDPRSIWRAQVDPCETSAAQPGRLMTFGTWLELARSAALDALGGGNGGGGSGNGGAGGNGGGRGNGGGANDDGHDLTISDLVVHTPLPLGERATLTTSFEPTSRSGGRLTVHARRGAGAWREQLSATVERSGRAGTRADADPQADSDPTPRPSFADQPYAPLRVELDTEPVDALLDSIDPGADGVWLVRSVGRARWFGPAADLVLAQISVGAGGDLLAELVTPASGPTAHIAELRLADADGRVRLELTQVRLKLVARADLPSPLSAKLLSVAWQAAEPAPPQPAEPAEPRHPSDSAPPAAAPARWLLIVDPADPRGAELARGLRARGAEVSTVAPAAPGDRHDALAGSGLPPDGVILLSPPPPVGQASPPGGPPPPVGQASPAVGQAPPDDTPARAERLVLQAIRIVAALSDRPHATARPTRVWFVTTGATTVTQADRPDPATAALRGLVRVLAYEHPELRPTWVDLDPTGLDVADLLHELALDDREDEVAWRGGRRHVARLMRPQLDHAEFHPARIVRRDGAYLVTGGLGGLGLLVARWLAASGAARIVLNGRSGPSPDAERTLAELRGSGSGPSSAAGSSSAAGPGPGCDVVVVTGDISQPDVARRAVAAANAGPLRLRGVIHAAAVIEDRVALRVEADSLHRVWSAKAAGAWSVSQACAGCDLDWWVGFSSVAALVGSPGQAAYAAANAFLDAVAASRRAAGLVAQTINWGSWSELGRAAERRADAVRPITPQEGLDALAILLGAGPAAVGVVRLDVAELAAAFPEVRDIPLFENVLEAAHAPADTPRPAWPGLDALDPLDADRLIADRVDERIAAVLGTVPGRLDRQIALTAAGLDSLLAVRVRNALQQDFNVLVPPSLLLRGASTDELVGWLRDALRLEQAPALEPAPARPPSVACVAPRDASERLVAAVWAEVLGHTRFGVTDDFESVGGDSTARARVTELVSLRSGRALLGGELLARPTIERQADLVRADDASPGTPLRLLREGVAPTPLFLFHPGGGDTLVYRQLIDQLDASIGVWGLDRLPGALSVEQRAEHYVELVRGAHASGPYLLAGWSFGGALAYETALRLSALGETVELVALIDTILPLPDPPDRSEAEILEERFRRFADFLEANYGRRVELPYARMARLDDEGQTDLMIETIVDAGLIDLERNAAILRHQRTSYLDVRASDRYRPAAQPTPVTYFSASAQQVDGMRDPRFARKDPSRGWNAVCGERLEVIKVPGHHLSLLDPPHVETLAAHLDRLLRPYRATPAAADSASTPKPRPAAAR